MAALPGSRLRITDSRMLVDLFNGIPPAVAAPGRLLLFQEAVEGRKASDGATSRVRPYYVCLLTDAVAVGKEHSSMIATSYRGHAYPLLSCHMWTHVATTPAQRDAYEQSSGSHAVHLRAGGRLDWHVHPLAYGASSASQGAASSRASGTHAALPSGSSGTPEETAEYVLYCSSVEQRDRLVASFNFLKRRLTGEDGSSSARDPSASVTAPSTGVASGPTGPITPGFAASTHTHTHTSAPVTAPEDAAAGQEGGTTTRLRAHARYRSSAPTASSGLASAPSTGDAPLDAASREGKLKALEALVRTHVPSGLPASTSAGSRISMRVTDAADGCTPDGERLSIGSVAAGGDAGAPDLALLPVATGEGVTIDAAALPRLPEMAPHMANDKDAKHRYSVYKELLETERAYVIDLQTAVRVFVLPLREAADSPKSILTRDVILRLFANMDVLLDLNAALLVSITNGLAKHADKQLSEVFADAFMRVMPFFRVYMTYCKNYWKALDVLRREQENERFQGFLRFCALKPEVRKRDLGAFLIKPVQRICKYPLLFKDLLKHMDGSHPHITKLQQALAEVERIATEVNERIAAEERQRRIFDCFTLLDGTIPDLVQPQRRFVTDVPEIGVSFPVVSTDHSDASLLGFGRASQKPRPLRLFLFSDILVIATFSHTVKPTPQAAEDEDAAIQQRLPGADPLPGVSTGAKYKPVEIISLRDVNTSAYVRATESKEDAPPASPSGSPNKPTAPVEAARAPVRSGVGSATAGASPAAGGAAAVPESKLDGDEGLRLSFEFMATKQVMSKDGTPSTAVTRVRIWCTSDAQRRELYTALFDAAVRSQTLARELQERRLSAQPGRTRAWRRKTTMGSNTLGGVGRRSNLAALRERYTADGGPPPEGGDSKLSDAGGEDGGAADDAGRGRRRSSYTYEDVDWGDSQGEQGSGDGEDASRHGSDWDSSDADAPMEPPASTGPRRATIPGGIAAAAPRIATEPAPATVPQGVAATPATASAPTAPAPTPALRSRPLPPLPNK